MTDAHPAGWASLGGHHPDWWRRAVVYEVYIRSFADGDGDGIGDIAGIRSRLPYLAGLGVDALWITPWYPSPMADGGYDIVDHRDIDPLFGSLADASALIREAHGLGLRVLIDIVPNHTSAEHPWFLEALAAPAGSAARDRYVFRPGRGPDGSQPPNGWQSMFGGSAWTRVMDAAVATGEWYLHLFDSSQPDLNWANPEVRAEFESILEFWLARGVDGFRIDVAHYLAKDTALQDLPEGGEPEPGQHPFQDREEIHEVYRGWRRVVDRHGGTAIFCGEIDLAADRIARFLRPDELHTAFNFDLLWRPWAAGPMRRSIERTLRSHAAVGAPATWVIGNHDLPRPPFRLGRDSTAETLNAWTRAVPSDQVLGTHRARAAALLTLGLPGVAYVYQGDELGLPEVLDLPPEARQDPTFHRTGGLEPGRDGDRVPMPWEGTVAPFGFGPAGSVPWLAQPAEWGALSVRAQDADPASTLALYRRALAIRRAHPGLAGDDFRWLDGPEGTLHFERGTGFRCLVNFAGEPTALPGATLIRSDPAASPGEPLPPGAAAWYEAPASGR